MDTFDPSELPVTAIRPATLAKLQAVALVREMDALDLLDEAVEAARARLAPKPKAPSTGGRRGRPKADQ